MKYSFKNDYAEGCHPNILKALAETNLQQEPGYGLDQFCTDATKLILEKTKSPNSKVFYVSGGTQANLLVISASLRPHESVISASTAHIFTNETGAIESTGHKIHAIEKTDGKLTPEDAQKIIDLHQNIPHQLKQKILYISNSTEIGTLYSKEELEALYLFCQEKNLYLFMDGARLGQALMAETNNLTLEDIAKYTDVFYLGGTKNGALFGEAIVINNPVLQEEFAYHIKQKGALLAKGRLLGIQFLELLKEDLYFQLAKKANTQAMQIKSAFKEKGILFLSETFTSQIFPILNLQQIDKLSVNFDFYKWKQIDQNHFAVRFLTSWATSEEKVNLLIDEIKNL